jgi:hypothetical protein
MRTTRGRPRVKGKKLPSPQEVVEKTMQRTTLTVAWYGGAQRAIEVVTGTGHWYRMGEALVKVRWLYVHDGTGTHRDEYFFTTDIAMHPQQIVECYTQRWSIETTFQECREYLHIESTKGYASQRCSAVPPVYLGYIRWWCSSIGSSQRLHEHMVPSYGRAKQPRPFPI